MKVKMQDKGLVLEGGAVRGIFTAGVLDYLMEREFYFPYVIGVSAGACNAVDYVSRQPERTKKCMIPESKEDSFINLRKTLKNRSLFDMDMLFDKYPNEIFPFDYETFFHSPIQCELVVSNCITGRPEYLSERSSKERLMKICRASSSIPIAAPMVSIDGTPCLDGGIADSIPILRSLKTGHKKNVLVLTRNLGYRKTPPGKRRAVYKAVFRDYPAFYRTICRRAYRYNKTLSYVEKWEREGKVFVIRPSVPEVSRTEQNPEVLQAFYQHGYDEMARQYDAMLEYLKNKISLLGRENKKVLRSKKVVTRDKKTQVLASLGMLLTAIIWGFAFVVVKNSLDLIPPTYMLAFRFTIAAVLLGLIFIRRMKTITKEVLIEGMIIGVFLFLSYLFQTIGCKYTTAGKNAFLTTVYVVIVPFLHWIMNKKRPDIYCVAAAFLAIVGIGLLSLQGDLSIQIGDTLTLICGFGFALHMIYIDRYGKRHDPVVLTVLQLATAAILGWVMAPVMDGGFPAAAFKKEIIVGMVYLGVFSTMVGFLLQNVCQKYTTPNMASLLLSMESVFGVMFSVIFLGEMLNFRMIVGCILIFTAIILAETKFSFLPFGKRKERVAKDV